MATNLVNFHLITLELVIVHTSDLVFLHLLRKIENVERSKIVGQVSTWSRDWLLDARIAQDRGGAAQELWAYAQR